MSTKQWKRDFDAAFMGMAPGLFDRGVYRASGLAPDAAGVPVNVKVDHGLRNWDDGGLPVADYDTSIGIQLAQVATPRKGDRVVLDDGEAFVLCERLRDDGSLSTWGVKHA